MNGSFHERSAWIQLISLVGVFGIATWRVGMMMANGETDLTAYAWVYGIAVAAQVIITIGAHILMSILLVTVGGESCDTIDARDERDKVIEWRAEASTAWLTSVGAVTGVILLIAGSDAVWVANAIVGMLFISGVMKLTLQLVWYRRGSALPAA